MLNGGWVGEGAQEKAVGAPGCPPLATLGPVYFPQAYCAQSAMRTPESPGANLPCSSAAGKAKSSYLRPEIMALGGLPI